MPAYNFQKQFIGKILSGEKPHTIRRKRKRPTKVGDVVKMFFGMRTKWCFQFAEAPCVKIEPVVIKPALEEAWIWVDEQPGDLYYSETEQIGSYRLLRREEMVDIALKDGFVNASQFFHFFKLYKQDVLNDFEIIWWNPNEMTWRVLLLVPDEGKSQPIGKNLEDTYSHRLIEVLTEKGVVHNEL